MRRKPCRRAMRPCRRFARCGNFSRRRTPTSPRADPVRTMQALLRDVKGENKVENSGTNEICAHLHFALRHAFEQATQYPAAFAHYALGNTLRRKAVPFSIATFDAKSQRMCRFFSIKFFSHRRSGCFDPAPRCYLDRMDHWNEVLPGKVLRLRFEALVREPETNIRRLLQHCGLKFEPACLSFHETKRAVRTPSAEQVRQPIYTTGIGYWRHFAQEVEPLRQAVGDSLKRF